MISVQFQDSLRYEFAADLAAPLGAIPDAASQTIAAHAPLAALISRVAQGKPAVLPIRYPDSDVWIVFGAVRRDLEAALTGVCRFVVPSYAEHAEVTPVHYTFDHLIDNHNALGLGSAIYPAGYYLLRSPTAHFGRVIERLGRWATLESERPLLKITHPPSYHDLLEAFNAALSAGTWDTAAAKLDEMQRLGLITADNLAFLEVQLLAQQGRWAELWHRENFADIARLRTPRAVRAALLAAFHQSELLPLEQAGKWAEALNAFRSLRGRLGGLLEGKVETTYGPALRAYAYREASAGSRTALELLFNHAVDDETRIVIESLAAMLPPTAPSVQIIPAVVAQMTPQQMLRLALADGDYLSAWLSAESMEDLTEQAQAMLHVAFMSDTAEHIEGALLCFWSLPQATQEALQNGNRRLAQIIKTLSALVSPPMVEKTEEALTDWLNWLAVAATHPDDPRLAKSLDLVARADDQYWTSERVALLSERLIELVTSETTMRRTYLREAVRRLRDQFLQDPEFPREDAAYADVYEALYLAVIEQHEVNERNTLALLRLAEARLARTPATRATITDHLLKWLSEPIPTLEGVALAVMDLLAAYGIQGPMIGVWYRSWAEAIMVSPRPRDRLNLEAWLALGEWSQPGEDLLDALRTRLTALGEREDDPIAALPSGFQIGIFILSAERAERVAEALRRRNPTLDIKVCDDKVLTDRARTIAQSSAMVVIVTGCVKHALTYGIGPYLRDPIYPASVGSTSILRAIEDRARSIMITA